MSALVASMAEKDKVGYARYRGSHSSVAQLVALLPQQPVFDEETGAVLMPCGMHVHPLPFAEDVRTVPKDTPLSRSEFTQHELDVTRDLAAALTFAPGDGPVGKATNPATHKHYAYLQAQAIGEPEVAATVDTTRPDEAFVGAAEPQALAFSAAFELPPLAELELPAKRARLPAPPKPAPPAASDLGAIRALCTSGELGSLTVAALKEICREHGLPLGGKKDALLERVRGFVDQPAAEPDDSGAMEPREEAAAAEWADADELADAGPEAEPEAEPEGEAEPDCPEPAGAEVSIIDDDF